MSFQACSALRLLAVICLIGSDPVGAQDQQQLGGEALRVLSARCFSCHGPDESQRKAELRLDREADARGKRDSGVPLVPGKASESLIVQRIEATDPDIVMPPPDAPHQLTSAEKQLLRRWVEQGAEWPGHWSFQPLQRPQVSAATGGAAIDELVRRQQSADKMQLRPAAAPHKLARRLFLDAIGLPPTVEEADAFAAAMAADREAAWERLIDSALARPEFGEHWARMWLDLARYADTKGYEKDLGRTVWPWRDWVVRSLNADVPLDQLTREMLAGDLLPNATPDQRLATAFHRQTMSNDEGGTDDEEFRIVAVKDRVDTTLQVWMGLTAGCARCHSHKYDPISQQDYYAFYAIWNQTQDSDRSDDAPTLEVLAGDIAEQRKVAQHEVDQLQQQVSAAEQVAAAADPGWKVPAVISANAEDGTQLQSRPDKSVLATARSPLENVYSLRLQLPAGRWTALRLQAFADLATGGPGVGRNPADPNFVLSEIELEREGSNGTQRLLLYQPRADFEQPGWPVTAALDGNLKTGWAVSPRQKENHAALFVLAQPLELPDATVLRLVLRQHYGNSLTLRRFLISFSSEPPEALQPLPTSPALRQLNEQLADAVRRRDALQSQIPRVPVMIAAAADKQRETRIHRRGNFLDPGESVQASLPAAFVNSASNPAANSPTRLDAANWLMAPDNPLTARVWANRIWARIFGIGIVETEEDFGLLGSPPSHPLLLDWLAVEYRDNWSLKQLLKQIFLSKVYQQDSAATPELLEQDPRSIWFTRGARYRLSAEVLRDQALAVSGLLSLKKGGPPVMPPQPDGLWRSTYNGQKWVNAEGEDRFRRALYTFLKRTTPYPSFTTFDGGSGEVCQIRRIRTNTPLQALVSLNDPVNLEAAGALALRMQAAGDDAAAVGLRHALIRPVTSTELQPIIRLQQEVAGQLEADSTRAAALLSAARIQPPAGVSAAELGGWVVAASAILNLDEFLTRN